MNIEHADWTIKINHFADNLHVVGSDGAEWCLSERTVIDEDNRIIATLQCHIGEGNRTITRIADLDANARRVAAIPDMLRALQRLRDADFLTDDERDMLAKLV